MVTREDVYKARAAEAAAYANVCRTRYEAALTAAEAAAWDVKAAAATTAAEAALERYIKLKRKYENKSKRRSSSSS